MNVGWGTGASKFSNIASIYVEIETASIYVKIETRGLVSSQWKKYMKYSVYHVTDLANEIVRKPPYVIFIFSSFHFRFRFFIGEYLFHLLIILDFFPQYTNLNLFPLWHYSFYSFICIIDLIYDIIKIYLTFLLKSNDGRFIRYQLETDWNQQKIFFDNSCCKVKKYIWSIIVSYITKVHSHVNVSRNLKINKIL